MNNDKIKDNANPRTLEGAEEKLVDLLYELVDLANIVVSNAKRDGNITAHMVNSISSFLSNNHITLPELMERKRQASSFIPAQTNRVNRAEPDGDYVKGYDPVYGLPIFADEDDEITTRQ